MFVYEYRRTENGGDAIFECDIYYTLCRILYSIAIPNIKMNVWLLQLDSHHLLVLFFLCQDNLVFGTIE